MTRKILFFFLLARAILIANIAQFLQMDIITIKRKTALNLIYLALLLIYKSSFKALHPSLDHYNFIRTCKILFLNHVYNFKVNDSFDCRRGSEYEGYLV